jgi:hypothetical protein
LHAGTPKIIFNIPRNPIRTKTLTGQKRLIEEERNSDAAKLLSEDVYVRTAIHRVIEKDGRDLKPL